MAHPSADGAQLPFEREVQERVSWLIRLRWIAGLGLLAGSVVGLPLLAVPVPYVPLALVGLGVLAYNLALAVLGTRVAETLRSRRRAVHLQIALDWIALAATVALTGGIRSPATVGFVFHLIVGAILLSRRSCYLLTAAAIGLAALLGALTGGASSVSDAPFAAAGDRTGLVELWVALSCLFAITTYLATSITAQLREKERALAESERSLERAYRGMHALHEIGQVVNSTLDTTEVLALIAEHATRLLRGKAAAIRLLDPTGRTLVVGGSYGLSAAYVDKGPVEVARSQVDAQAIMGGIVEVADVTDDPRFQYPDAARREGLRSMLCSPMRAKGRTLGVLRVYTGEPRTFGAEDDELLTSLANLGAVAIENARSFGALQALDNERVWFARTTHHQLRTPLAAVQTALDALPFAGPLNDAQRELLSRVRRRIQDAFDMVRDLLDLAAAQRLEGRQAPGAVRLDYALERVLAMIGERARGKGLAFDGAREDREWGGGGGGLGRAFDAAHAVGEWRLSAEAVDLERIFANLLDNAVKYTRAGRVAFRASCRDGWLEARVEDTGMGIEPADRERVFDSFYRAPSAKATGEVGTGLGLAIVRQLVARLSGTIAIESTPGRGTNVTVRLPVVAAHPGEPSDPTRRAAPRASPPAR